MVDHREQMGAELTGNGFNNSFPYDFFVCLYLNYCLYFCYRLLHFSRFIQVLVFLLPSL